MDVNNIFFRILLKEINVFIKNSGRGEGVSNLAVERERAIPRSRLHKLAFVRGVAIGQPATEGPEVRKQRPCSRKISSLPFKIN